MATRAFTVKEGLMYILVGGVVLFFAIFLGIRAGFAIRGDGAPSELTPDNLPNRSHLKVGDPFPQLQVITPENETLDLNAVIQNRPTVLAVVLPGCEPCKNLLKKWETNGIAGAESNVQIVLLAAVPPDELDLGPLTEHGANFQYYFVEFAQLDTNCGITSFPSLMGVTADHTVGFVANAYVHRLDMEFFEKYL
jgi:hypothetical protein